MGPIFRGHDAKLLDRDCVLTVWSLVDPVLVHFPQNFRKAVPHGYPGLRILTPAAFVLSDDAAFLSALSFARSLRLFHSAFTADCRTRFLNLEGQRDEFALVNGLR